MCVIVMKVGDDCLNMSAICKNLFTLDNIMHYSYLYTNDDRVIINFSRDLFKGFTTISIKIKNIATEKKGIFYDLEYSYDLCRKTGDITNIHLMIRLSGIYKFENVKYSEMRNCRFKDFFKDDYFVYKYPIILDLMNDNLKRQIMLNMMRILNVNKYSIEELSIER